MLFARVYLPFALGYAISYFFRNSNAIIEADLVREIGLGPAELGLLTSVYFFSFAAFQLPLGILLDRYGPRRSEAILLFFAAIGAWIFSQSDSLLGLIFGRLLIGLGVSACLMAAFKAYVIWFPNESLPMINGLQMVAGGLGALTATTPLQSALSSFSDWRGIFAILAIITVFSAIIIWWVSPEKQNDVEQQPELITQFKEIGKVFRSPVFWSIAPFAAISGGTNMAIHGLWIKPWLRDVAGIGVDSAAQLMFAMTMASIMGFLSLGILAERVSQFFNFRPITIGVFGMTLFLLAQSAMAYGWISSPVLLVILLGFFGTSSILIFAGYAQIFPKYLSGRVSTILNFLIFVSAFILQWGIGVIIEMWQATGSGYDPESYQAAIGVLVILQVAGLAWYFFQQLSKSQLRTT